MTASLGRQTDSLSRLATDFAREVPGVAHAAVVGSSGVLVAGSAGLTPGRGAEVSEMASRLLQVAAEAAGRLNNGGVLQTMVEMERGYLYLMSLSGGGCLATVATPRCDLGLLAYEMTLLVDRIELELAPEKLRDARRAG